MAKGWFQIEGVIIDTDSRKGTCWLDPEKIKRLSPAAKQRITQFVRDLARKLNAQGIQAEAKTVDEIEQFYNKKRLWGHAYILMHAPVKGHEVPKLANQFMIEERQQDTPFDNWVATEPKHVTRLTNTGVDYIGHMFEDFVITRDGKPAEAELFAMLKLIHITKDSIATALQPYHVDYKMPQGFKNKSAKAELIEDILQQERGIGKISY